MNEDVDKKRKKIINVSTQNISVEKMGYSEFFHADSKFDFVLDEIIPFLKNFQFISGEEGAVYFIDDDYIIKKMQIEANNIENFNNYCVEIKNFGDSGLAVPKIYGWKVVDKNENFCDGYILEQRLKGQRLFESDISNIYDKCKNFCSRDEFLLAIKNKNENKELFGLIVKTYLESFLASNKKLLSLSDEAINHFIVSDFQMNLKANYGYPDTHSENIILADECIKMVDNFFQKRTIDKDVEMIKINVLKDILMVFCYNQISHKYLEFDFGYRDQLKKIQKENLDICAESMKRMIKIANKEICPILKFPLDLISCEDYVKRVLSKKHVRRVCKEIQKDFW